MLKATDTTFSKDLAKVKPEQFKKWFNDHFEGDWEKVYKDLGGKIEKKEPSK